MDNLVIRNLNSRIRQVQKQRQNWKRNWRHGSEIGVIKKPKIPAAWRKIVNTAYRIVAVSGSFAYALVRQRRTQAAQDDRMLLRSTVAMPNILIVVSTKTALKLWQLVGIDSPHVAFGVVGDPDGVKAETDGICAGIIAVLINDSAGF